MPTEYWVLITLAVTAIVSMLVVGIFGPTES